MDTTDFPALTEAERDAMERLETALVTGYEGHKTGLMRARLDGVTDVAVVVTADYSRGDGLTAVYPLAIILTPGEDSSLADRLIPAGDEHRIREN